MSQKERIKTALDFLKTLIFTLLTALFGICAYSFIHYKGFNAYDFIIISCVSLVFILVLIITLKYFIKELDKLEKEN